MHIMFLKLEIKFFAIVLVLLITIISNVYANSAIECTPESENVLRCSFELPDYNLSEKQWISKWVKTTEPGKPQLPQTGFFLQVTEYDKIHIDIIDSHYKHQHVLFVSPAPGVDHNNQRLLKKDEYLYQSDTYYPDTIFQISPILHWSQTPIVRILIRPFQWNPEQKDLKIIQQMNFKLITSSKRNLCNLSTISINKSDLDAVKSGIIANYVPMVSSIKKNVRPKNIRPTFYKLNLSLSKNGIYALTYNDFQLYDFPISEYPIEYLQLWNKGKQVPLDIESQSYYFQENDQVRFYGETVDSNYSYTNVYQILWGTEKGLRMTALDVSPDQSKTTLRYGFQSQLYEINNPKELWTQTPGAPEIDFIYWEKLTAPDSFTALFDLVNFEANASPAQITITAQGKTNSKHNLSVLINNNLVHQNVWQQATRFDDTFSIEASLLKKENNILEIKTWLEGSAVLDIVYIDQFFIQYPIHLIAQNDRITTEFKNFQSNVEITGFTNNNIYLYDISTSYAPKKMINQNISVSNNDYNVRFFNKESKHIFTTSETGIYSPDIRIASSERLKSKDLVFDYIIITPEKYFSAVIPLINYHEQKGRKVITVSPTEIFDTFNGGIIHPQAIQDFLKYAYHEWSSPKPKYVLMAGDSNIDYRDCFETHKQNDAPLNLSFMEDIGITPDDNYYVCTDGEDSIPDMIIGRIPGQNVSDISDIVKKTISYGEKYLLSPQTNLFISDNDPLNVFADINQSVMDFFEENMEQVHLQLSNNWTIEAFKKQLINHLNQGSLITCYVGHGDTNNWAGESIFQTGDILKIHDDTFLSLFFSLNCLSGFFGLPDRYSLSESLIKAKNKGAIGVFAPTALTQTWEVGFLIREIFEIIHSHPTLSIGELLTIAKISAYGKGLRLDTVKMYTFMGDPAMPLNIHTRGLPGDANNDGILSLSDIILLLKVFSDLQNEVSIFPMDINNNCRVDFVDFLYIMGKISE